MPSFVYQARDSQGERTFGSRDAVSQQEALTALRAAGLFVTKLVAADSAEAHQLFPDGLPTPAAPVQTEANGDGGVADLPAKKWQLTPEQEAKSDTPAITPAVEKLPLNKAPGEQAPPRRESFDPLRTPPAPRKGQEKLPETPSGREKPETAASPSPVPNLKPALPSQTLPPLPPRLNLRANTKDVALFWKQMHSMLHAGVSVSHAVSTMAENASSKGLRTACGEMAPRLATGKPLSELLPSYPGIFSPLMAAMIRAGEAGGFLDRMCGRLSEYGDRDYAIQQSIKQETWYPKLLLFTATYIPTLIPAAISYFQGGGFLRPWIAASWPITLFWVSLFLVMRFKNYLVPLTKHLKPLVFAVDFVKLAIPISGKTTRSFATAKFCRTLGALQAAGMGIRQTIDLAADACGNAVIAQTARKSLEKIEQGATLTEGLASTGQFSGIAIQMLRTGETSGNVEGQLDKVADYLETDGETTVKQAVVALGILAFLLIALYVAISVIGQWQHYADGMMKDLDN